MTSVLCNLIVTRCVALVGRVTFSVLTGGTFSVLTGDHSCFFPHGDPCHAITQGL